jgi:hypothetical protein
MSMEKCCVQSWRKVEGGDKGEIIGTSNKMDCAKPEKTECISKKFTKEPTS